MTRPMFPYAERLKAEMLAVIEDPMRWPHAILPVKRRTEDDRMEPAASHEDLSRG
jgi:hypothetical protein